MTLAERSTLNSVDEQCLQHRNCFVCCSDCVSDEGVVDGTEQTRATASGGINFKDFPDNQIANFHIV